MSDSEFTGKTVRIKPESFLDKLLRNLGIEIVRDSEDVEPITVPAEYLNPKSRDAIFVRDMAVNASAYIDYSDIRIDRYKRAWINLNAYISEHRVDSSLIRVTRLKKGYSILTTPLSGYPKRTFEVDHAFVVDVSWDEYAPILEIR